MQYTRFVLTSLSAWFFFLNFYFSLSFLDGYTRAWKKVGTVGPSGTGGQLVKLDSVVWAGGKMVPAVGLGRRAVYRVVTAIGPPFVMHAPLQQDRQCLRGVQCYQMTTSNKDNITMIFKDVKLDVNKKWVTNS